MIYAYVAAGGAIGSVLRYWLAAAVARLTGPGFPWGTVLINILGSLLIGVFAGLTAQGRDRDADALRAFLMAGICGGFTTFSAFSLQTADLLRQGHTASAAANILLSVALCVAATFLGLCLARS